MAEDGGAGDLAARDSAEGSDGKEKGEQGVLGLASESKGVRT